MNRVVPLLAGLLLLSSPAMLRSQSPDKLPLPKSGTILFLGDSNTFAGGYVIALDAYLKTRFPDRDWTLINLGLPSETISGLSEEDHPYPRPNVQDRIDAALTKTKPAMVCIAYGMNDGIYAPFDSMRLKQYQAGVATAIRKSRAVGASVMLLTPDPFDPIPVSARTQPITGKRFSYIHPFHDYDSVLANYAQWLVTQRAENLPVADAHTTITRYLAMARKDDPKTVLSGDGIHPNATGHWLVAHSILTEWNAPREVDDLTIRFSEEKAPANGIRRLSTTVKLPMPIDPAWDRRLKSSEFDPQQWNAQILRIRGIEGGRYALRETNGKMLGEFSHEVLAKGIDLSQIPALSTNVDAQEVLRLLKSIHQTRDLAWLTDVGHRRPDTPKGIPLADALAKVKPMEETVRKLTAPRQLQLDLERIGD
ncbi:GDSL-type esterase/lipase family protein [Tuwongella immobilis]|uniref:SGNH hydrolase-type esterase domain-containing protein n=1 Tax=Tuwongella immobilis TaxID=692036 RepID=A0A6C2YPQ9_9BACT|nr:GDSL-type esterase/lipase family protein [Tuwongella immobilis]VIP03337.1 g-d-s-l family lipolytic protein : Uncharacterized protein OS=Lentisphaera araneosa HTCC2155 GN=LNTAR_17788 PE=4 SV=1: Lipase_GDSL_2 [Tuwongella immobilis]VTS04046.1 g-d-s-l family lipolytic protein : Uncharacterized protein OS=Lentisphaera araneosa HTCC2155 GN=LNTAR_17788 PE=4 SV=1: Lipase_GDSL_2 [Tuwongella immobilis]